ncbi:MAG: hypothetical protein RQ833_04800 [Sphingomonadaceae bacterium]|nr:hypothetical protein [Sphingomonadaceae bacterium]
MQDTITPPPPIEQAGRTASEAALDQVRTAADAAQAAADKAKADSISEAGAKNLEGSAKHGAVVVSSDGGTVTTSYSSDDRGDYSRQHQREKSDTLLGALGISVPVFILIIVFGYKLLRDYMAIRRGYPIRSRGKWVEPAGGSPDAQRAQQLLTNENERLRGQVTRLEERVAVLERIVTDPAKRVADEIEALRR